jgi:hypothetical protein
LSDHGLVISELNVVQQWRRWYAGVAERLVDLVESIESPREAGVNSHVLAERQ